GPRQMSEFLVGVFALALGGAAGLFAQRIIRGPAYKTRAELIEQAERDAENVRKTAELAAKAEALQRREAIERELNVTREELRSHEKHLDKRESALDEIQEDIAKKERMLEN